MDNRNRPNRLKLTKIVKLSDKFKITLIDLFKHAEEEIDNIYLWNLW